jgi:hypothetical protein
MNRNWYLIILLGILPVDSGCFKSNADQVNTAVITGVNLRACPCNVACPCACGGIYFHFTDTGDTSNIIVDNPGIFQLSTQIRSFPVNLKVHWKSSSRCGMKAIVVGSFSFQ